MEPTITTFGALLGLITGIVLIVFNIPPAYSMILGAMIGGIVGGAGLVDTVNFMVIGAEGMIPTVLRVLTAGVLAGSLIKSGAADKISNFIIKKLGENRALLSIALATGILTAVGVFGDIAVITVAPIALTLGNRLGYSTLVLIVALMGGEKAGMAISPNPQAIAISSGLNIDLITLMYSNIIPAIVGLIVTVIVCSLLAKSVKKRGEENAIAETDENENFNEEELPSLWASLSGPIIVISLLILRPLFGVEIDPMIALPVGGIIGIALMGKIKNTISYLTYGLDKMVPIVGILIGTGTIAGIIENSYFQADMMNLLETFNLSALLAPISTIIMSGATSSSAAGSAVAVETFGEAVTEFTSPLAAGAMMHAGSIVLDSLPHGSIFHSSAGVMNMSIKNRFKALPYEILIGLIIAVTSTLIFGLF